jgi:hypothetical protein
LRPIVREALVIAFFVVATVLLTWPLARHLSSAITDVGDPYVSISILDWAWDATFHQPALLFHQPIFHPAKYTLAFTEHLYGIALFAFPLYLVGFSSITIYNIVLILGYASCGYGAYLLSRLLTGCVPASIAGGVFFAFLPYRITQNPHISYVWAAWLPLLLAALIVYDRRPDWKRAILFGAAFFANAITCAHWLAMGGLAIALTVIMLWMVRRHDLLYGLRLAAVSLIALLVLTPFLLPYLKVGDLYGMTRRVGEVEYFSAELRDWFIAGPHLPYGWLVHDPEVNPERWLFPGFLPLIFSMLGLIFYRRMNGSIGVAVALLWIAIGVLGSFGLNAFFHTLLFEYVRPFQSIRVAARWAMIAYVGLSILVSFGVAALTQLRWRMVRKTAPYAASLLMLLEFSPAPMTWYLAPVETPPVYQWLADAPAPGALFELPIATFTSEYEYLRHARDHGRPLINGVSSFIPPEFENLIRTAHADPIGPQLIDRLETSGTAFVVVHADRLYDRDRSTREWLRQQLQSGRLSFVRRFPRRTRGDYLFAVNRVVPAAAFLREPERADASGATPSEHLQSFLNGTYTYFDEPIMTVDRPVGGSNVRGPMTLSGWAAAPGGVQQVNLRFRNEAVLIEAQLEPRPELTRNVIGYPDGSATGFRYHFESVPRWAGDPVDVIIEVVGRSGKAKRFEPFFIDWRTRGDIRPDDWNGEALAALLKRLGEDQTRPRVTRRWMIDAVLRETRALDDSEFVRQSYLILMNHPATPERLEYYNSALRAGRPRREIIKSLLRDEEFQRVHLQ